MPSAPPIIPPSPAAAEATRDWLTELMSGRVSNQLARRLGMYALSVALVGVATWLDRVVPPLLNESGIPLFFAAITLSAWYGGWGPSMVATLLSAVATTWVFDNPAGAPPVGWDDVIRTGVFLLVAALISSLTSIRKRAEEALQRSHAELEQRVHRRTAELRASNDLLRQSEERFRVLVEGVADYAIVLLDARGTVVSWNSGAQRIYGYEADGIIGQPFTRFYAEEDQSRGEAARQLGAATVGGRLEDEGWRRRKDGSRFWANVILTALTDGQGGLRGFAQVTRDATELRLLERQVLEVIEAEQRRFGHDLHDGLGQELTGLAFLAQNLQRELSDAGRPEADRAGRIHDLINRALDATREMAHGFSPVELGPDGLREALRDMARRAEELFDVPCTFRATGEPRVDEDSAALHLYRIAQEAVNNAVRHGRPSRVRIALDGRADGGEGRSDVTLTVEDDGSGLPPEEVRRPGLGLRAMLYRARVIGASLDVRVGPHGGTIVTCAYANRAAGASRAAGGSAAGSADRAGAEDDEHGKADDRHREQGRAQGNSSGATGRHEHDHGQQQHDAPLPQAFRRSAGGG